ncbi:MAG: hypothetical protein ABI234_20800 [Ktedonobacteraceae bacterium]
MLQLHYRLPRVYGAALFVPALVGDCLLGILFLGQGEWQLLLWHFPLTLIWAMGVNLMAGQGERQKVFSFASWNKWGLSALLLGLGTLPGFGTCVYSLAFLLITYLFAPSTTQNQAINEPGLAAGTAFTDLLPLRDKIAQPLVDDMYEGNTEARRAVVAKLSRAAQPNTTQLLRQLLFDTQAEIRSDASIALARLDDDLSRTLNLSFQAWTANPTDTKLTLALVDQYYQYAISNVLDSKSQHFYLLLARDHLSDVITREKLHDAQLWLTLARIRQRLGELPEALQDARRALNIQPDLSEAALLAMELAFHTHAWDTLITLAGPGTIAVPPQTDRPADLPSLQWLAALPSKMGVGGRA